MSKKTIALMILATVISGTAWSLIPSQHAHILPEYSIFYRFILASIALFGVSAAKGLMKPIKRQDHLKLFFVGICLYGVFCSLSYRATDYLSTGLISLFVALMIIPNTFIELIMLRKRLSFEFLLCFLLTIIGCIIIFLTDIHPLHENEYIGISLAIVAVCIYSYGSFISSKVKHENISKIYQSAWSMLYGALFSIVLGFLIHGKITLQFDFSNKYILSLLALGMFFSPFVFATYVYLIEKIGQSKASYIWVGMPIIAIFISSKVEGLEITRSFIFGVSLILIGLIIEKIKPLERYLENEKRRK